MIIVRSPGKAVKMTFRERTTGICDELLQELEGIVGAQNIRT